MPPVGKTTAPFIFFLLNLSAGGFLTAPGRRAHPCQSMRVAPRSPSESLGASAADPTIRFVPTSGGFSRPPPPSGLITARSYKTRRFSAVGWIAATVAGGTLGSAAFVPRKSPTAATWYDRIPTPCWTPPGRWIPPIWVALYSTMGYSAWTVYNKTGLTIVPLGLAFVHYGLNLLWAPVFFGQRKLRAGFWISVLQLLTLLFVLTSFHGVDPTSAYLLLPLFGWLIFATALNGAICRLNPTRGGYNNAMMEADILKLREGATTRAGLES